MNMSSTGAPPTQETLPESVIMEAAKWYADLMAEDLSPASHPGLQRWLAADPRHRQAWERIGRVRERFASVPAGRAGSVLTLAQASRRQWLRGAGALAGLGLLGGGLYRYLPWMHWQADYRTGIGEQARFLLDDQTEILLNTDSAVDVRFDAGHRHLFLRAGEVLVQTSVPQPSRPLWLHTRHGRIETVHARFVVRMDEQRTRLVLLREGADVCPGHHEAARRTIEAEQGLWFDTEQVGGLHVPTTAADAWAKGQLSVLNMPLAEFLDELSRYRRGYLGCHPDVAELRISGVFPLQDIDEALAVLQESTGLVRRSLGPYWVRFEPRSI